MGKYKDKYRIPSARYPNSDYAKDGAYFITICTKNRTHFLGECVDAKMTLSTVGAIIQGFWYEIPKYSPHVELGEFIVMPNHIHGVLILSSNEGVETLHRNVCNSENEINKNEFFQKISPKSGSVSTIIRSYKSVCSKHIHAAFPELSFDWQARFWDNIIETDESFERISNYIFNNPKNWKDDKFFGDEFPEN
jgi:putative transposase